MTMTLKKLFTALALCLIPLVTTGLGWLLGGGDLSTFIEKPVRSCLVLFSMAGFFIGPFVTGRIQNRVSKGQRHDRGQDRMILLATLTGVVLSLVGPWSDAAGYGYLPGGAYLRWAGMAIYAVGFWLMVWAPVYLGKQFSVHVTIQEDHELITSGPFAFMRHPRYAGCVYWAIGMALVFASTPGLLVAIVYTGLFIWRINDEERLLAAHFQQQWNAYALRTKRLLPFVY